MTVSVGLEECAQNGPVHSDAHVTSLIIMNFFFNNILAKNRAQWKMIYFAFIMSLFYEHGFVIIEKNFETHP